MSEVQKISLSKSLRGAVWTQHERNTVRVGDKYEALHPGPAKFVVETDKDIPITVTAVTKKRFDQLTEEDAAKQGQTLDRLKYELKDVFYAHMKINKNTPVYVIDFNAPPVSAALKTIAEAVKALADEGACEGVSIYYRPKEEDPELQMMGDCIGTLVFESDETDAFQRISKIHQALPLGHSPKFERQGRFQMLSLTGDMGSYATFLKRIADLEGDIKPALRP